MSSVVAPADAAYTKPRTAETAATETHLFMITPSGRVFVTTGGLQSQLRKQKKKFNLSVTPHQASGLRSTHGSRAAIIAPISRTLVQLRPVVGEPQALSMRSGLNCEPPAPAAP